MGYTFQDLGLPSIGEFSISAMRSHRNPIVASLGGLLQMKANYLPGDRFTVVSIQTMANYTRPLGRTPAVGRIDMSMIEIGTMSGYHRTLTHQRFLPSGARGLPLTRLWIPEREDALVRMIRTRYGEAAVSRMLDHFRSQHWTFEV